MSTKKMMNNKIPGDIQEKNAYEGGMNGKRKIYNCNFIYHNHLLAWMDCV